MNDARADLPVIGIVGGSGAEGSGLAFRWARAGYPVVLGSRSLDKAHAAAANLNALLGADLVRGTLNDDAARAGAIVVLTVPYAGQLATAQELLPELRGKILVDVTVPLKPPKVDHVALPEGGSAVAVLQQTLGDEVRVVAAFQNVSAHHLKDPGYVIDCDVLVCGNDKDARELVVTLATAAGFVALHAGPIVNAAAIEAMTSVLIFINKRYKVPGSGLRITGVKSR